jgi:hypothetical protein
VLQRFDIFMSYSRADMARVQPLEEALRAMGYRVFFDVESITPGEQWKRRLDSSIRASRVLLLCWSAQAAGSDFVHFEYHRAGGLGKKVVPWLLDHTPLPEMLEIQGITAADPEQAAMAVQVALGWGLTRRRWVTAGAVAAVAGAVCLGWPKAPPPARPRFVFRGHVQDERGPVAGATVSANGVAAVSKVDGSFELTLAADPGPTINLRVSRQGYQTRQIDNADFQVPDFGVTLEHAR